MDGNEELREATASQFHYGGKNPAAYKKKVVVSASFQERFNRERPLLPKEDE